MDVVGRVDVGAECGGDGVSGDIDVLLALLLDIFLGDVCHAAVGDGTLL